MRRFLIYFLGVALGGLLVWKYPLMRMHMDVDAKTNSSFAITGVHKTLVQERQWLNTSRPLEADDLKGRIILVDFWTFCCINCIHLIPELQKLEEEFGDEITVIGVHSGKFFNERDVENIREAVLRYGIEHPVVNDAGFKVWNGFGTRAWPTLVVINPTGRIEKVYTGEGHLEELRHDIAQLKKEYAGNSHRTKLPIALEKKKERASLLAFPGKLEFAPDRKLLFIADSEKNRIVVATLEGRVEWAIGGAERGRADGDFDKARFNAPQGLLYRDGMLYVADTENHLLRSIDLERRKVTTLAGTGERGTERIVFAGDPKTTGLASPWDLAFSPDGEEIIIAHAGTHQLWGYHLKKKVLRVVAGNGIESIDDGNYPQNSLSQPSGLSAIGDKLYFVDSETSSLRLLQNGKITTLVGTGLFDFGLKDGKGKKGQLQHPLGLFADASGVFIADAYNHAIRFYDPATQELTTLTGKGEAGFADGTLSDALFSEPNDLIRIDGKLYVADTNNHQIRVIDLQEKRVSTLGLSFPRASNLQRPTEGLSNLKRATTTTIKAGTALPVMLQFDKGWKLNAQAPSWLALYQGERLVIAFDQQKLLTGKLSLPALEQGKRYLLQGTFYYCREGKEAQCFVQSYQQELAADSKGEEHLTIFPG